jgi:hypothetical protein
VPKANIFAWLVNPNNFETAPSIKDVADGALKLGLEFHVLDARSEPEIDDPFAKAGSCLRPFRAQQTSVVP